MKIIFILCVEKGENKTINYFLFNYIYNNL